MAYCSIADVQGLNPQRPDYSASTKPTSTEVGDMITRCSEQIDNRLKGRGLTVPITTPTSFVNELILINSYGAAALAEMAAFPGVAGPGSTPQGDRYMKLFREGLDWLSNGTLPIENGGPTGRPQSFFQDRAGDTEEPTRDNSWQNEKFQKNKEF